MVEMNVDGITSVRGGLHKGFSLVKDRLEGHDLELDDLKRRVAKLEGKKIVEEGARR